jgi:predicted dehydrogenase
VAQPLLPAGAVAGYLRLVRSVIQIGCGQVARERIFPAIKGLAAAGVLSVGHVVDVLPLERVAEALDQLAPVHAFYHQVDPRPEAVARLLRQEGLAGLPVIVATPTSLHSEHARAALAANCPVGLEKPLAGNARGLDEIAAFLDAHDPRLLFPFGYYLIEKGLPLLALARRGQLTPTQLSLLDGIGGDEWAELRDALGPVSRVTAMLREGPDTRAWVRESESGGQTLETFSHLVAMVLPWFESISLGNIVLGRTPAAPKGPMESMIYAELVGPRREQIVLGCEKWSPENKVARWMHIAFARGTASMDFETQRLTVKLPSRRRTAGVATRVKYEPQLRMFASKLDNLDEPTEYEVARRSALLSIAVREVGFANGLRSLPSSWLDEHIGELSDG